MPSARSAPHARFPTTSGPACTWTAWRRSSRCTGRIATSWHGCGRQSTGPWPPGRSGTRSTTGPGGTPWPSWPTATGKRRSASSPGRGRNAWGGTAHKAAPTSDPPEPRERVRPARGAVAGLGCCLPGREAPALHRSARFAAGILDGGPGALLGAAAGYAAAGRPLLAGQAREHEADLLAAAGRTGEARAQLDAAQDCYARLDAVWDAAPADARLRAYGVRRGTPGPRPRPPVPPGRPHPDPAEGR